MGESVGSRGTFGVSVSFGKYENDALSWEKWSTFSPNKYLEEVGKCSTPGSVAQKKAFFEAHYKKIAAMKAEAELLDQEKATPLRSDDHTEENFEDIKEQQKDFVESKACLNVEQVQAEISKFDGSGKPQEDKPDSYQSRCKEEASLVKHESYQSQCKEEASLVNDERFQDESLQSGNALEPQNLLQSQSPITLNSNADKLEEAVLVNDESMKLVKQHFQVDLETRGPQKSKPEIPKLKAQNVLRKVNPTLVEKNSTGMKKKPASIIPKSPETSATRSSKPKATPTSSLKKANASSSSKSKNHLVSESKRVAPTSFHLSMSMSMNSVNSDTASSVTSSRRRSLFMEQMGDKDIVKRAFKTFQNRVNQLPSFDSGTKQLPAKGSEAKASTSRAYQKENERSRKAAEKITPARGQLGTTWKSVSSGSLKGVGVDERQIKVTPKSNSVVLTSNERRKEFFKNLEEKSNAREAEKSRLGSKSKQVKDAEMKTLKQNHNFKAKPMPSFYRAQGVSSKSTSEKEATKQTRCT